MTHANEAVNVSANYYSQAVQLDIEAIVDIESGDNIDEAYSKLRNWVSVRLHKAADEEAPDRPKPFKPEDMY